MRPVDFIGIGVQKSGTTWLYENLRQLPEFQFLPIKEVHYFDRKITYPSPNRLSTTYYWQRLLNPFSYFSKGISKEDAEFFKKYKYGTYNDDWYLSLFENKTGIIGEITPSYSILDKNDIMRINLLLPEVKLILLVRNPIHRAWSQYRFILKRLMKYGIKKVPESIMIKFLDSRGQELRSNYLRTITLYSEVFKKDQLLIGFYDAIESAPKNLFLNVLKHIEPNNSFSIDHLNLEKRVGVSPIIEIPKRVHDHLNAKYLEPLNTLSNLYGGYFTKWYLEASGDKIAFENLDLKSTIYP